MTGTQSVKRDAGRFPVPIILIDIGPLVALCDGRDEKHRVAMKHLHSLISGEFAVCEAVLMEACFHLAHKSQRQRLRALIEDLGVQSVPVANETGFWWEVFAWLSKYAEHQPDWADGCLAVLSEWLGNAEVWTYAREFRTTSRRRNGTIIPLAARST